jgi:hypothetical protein
LALFGRRPSERADKVDAAGVQKPAQQRTRKDHNVMSDQCQGLANEIHQLIDKIPPPDIPLLIREMLKRELIGCEQEIGAVETNHLIASLFPPQPPHQGLSLPPLGAETMASLHRYTEAMVTKVLVERGLIPAPVEELSDIGFVAANLYWNWQRSLVRHVVTALLAAEPSVPSKSELNV